MIRYLVMVMRTPNFQASLINAHKDFLEELRQNGSMEMSGPFTDKTGGAYLIKADSLEAAEALAFADPLHTSGSSQISVYEWDAK